MAKIQVSKYLDLQAEQDKQVVNSGEETNLTKTIKKLIADIEDVKIQKNDTGNLKNSYKQFVEDHNASIGELKARISAVEELLKQLVYRVNKIESL